MSDWRDPITRAQGRRRWRRLVALITGGAAILAVGLWASDRYAPNRPVNYADPLEHFKYGSIGSDAENGLPLDIVRVLPSVFPEYLPPGAGPRDYRAFGFLQEPSRPMPIGFSVRRRILDRTNLNCAACHTGVVRRSADGPPMIVYGMPANTVDLQAFFEFLFRCADDPRFTPEALLAEIEADRPLFVVDRLLIRRAIPRMRAELRDRQGRLAFLFEPGHPRFGPGRVDTFNPYKTDQAAAGYPDGIPADERIGTVDFPSVWNQAPRDGMELQWDGNNPSLRERNVSASFGAGATRESVDLPRIGRIERWLAALPPPPYPDEVDRSQLTRGEAVYRAACSRCHDLGGADVGRVVPIDQLGTDRHRLDSYTPKFNGLLLAYGDGYSWDFQHFRKTNGYANTPLDGIWARAPYLHNGSVPTLWDLLTPAERRPATFYRGHGVLDPEGLGVRGDVEEVNGRPSFLFNTTLPGNGNGGHTGEPYGTELHDDDKRALIEYLKTL